MHLSSVSNAGPPTAIQPLCAHKRTNAVNITSLLAFHFLLRCFLRLFECFGCWRPFASGGTHFLAAAFLNPFTFRVDIGIQTRFLSHYFFAFAIHLPLRAHAIGVGQPAQGLNLGAAPIFFIPPDFDPYAINTSIGYHIHTTLHDTAQIPFQLSTPAHHRARQRSRGLACHRQTQRIRQVRRS